MMEVLRFEQSGVQRNIITFYRLSVLSNFITETIQRRMLIPRRTERDYGVHDLPRLPPRQTSILPRHQQTWPSTSGKQNYTGSELRAILTSQRSTRSRRPAAAAADERTGE